MKSFPKKTAEKGNSLVIYLPAKFVGKTQTYNFFALQIIYTLLFYVTNNIHSSLLTVTNRIHCFITFIFSILQGIQLFRFSIDHAKGSSLPLQ